MALHRLGEWGSRERECPGNLSLDPELTKEAVVLGVRNRRTVEDVVSCDARVEQSAQLARRGYAVAWYPSVEAADRGGEPGVAAPSASLTDLLPSVELFPVPWVCALNSALSKRTTLLRPVSFAT